MRIERILGLVRNLPRLIGSLAPTVITKMFMGIVSSVPLTHTRRTSHLFTHTRRTSHLFTHTRRTAVELRPVVMELLRILKTEVERVHTMVVWLRGAVSFFL